MSTPPRQVDAAELKRLFIRAVETPAEQRGAILEPLAAQDPGLHEALVQLLRAHDAAGEFLSQPTRDGSAAGAGGAPEEAVDDRVGPFVLVERLGEGGFAVVWRAGQEQPVRREVALKILKPGMDSRQILARFDAERQTLALLNHPSIARVLDAGVTPRGRPYFAMDLVAGRPITQFCDEARLSIRERLELFIAVCNAVQHAHQKGIVHRDLKPSNILVRTVDGRPLPVVIDFGIAKAIEGGPGDETALTEERQIIGTPQYMAPEQADFDRGAADTRTDVYSLGILLYELLTGVSPYDLTKLKSAGIAERARIVRDTRPSKPSTRFMSLGPERIGVAATRRTDEGRLARELRGDLDWIVLRATERDPEHRYPTAYALGQDVRHHLRNEPVAAGPPSRAYLVRKFVRRHRVIVSWAAVAGLAVVAGLALALAGLGEANAMREKAEQALRTAERRLWESYAAQARASRASAEAGRRGAALAAAGQAAGLRATLEIRNEAIAALALDDVEFAEAPRQRTVLGAWGLARPSHLLCAEQAGEARVVRVSDGAEVARIAVPGMQVTAGAFNSAGTMLAYALRGPEGEEVRVSMLAGGDPVCSIAGLAPYGGELRLGGSPAASAWLAVATGRAIEVRSIPNGDNLLDIPTGREELRFEVGPDGDELILADGAAGHVQRWSVARGECVATIITPSPPVSVAASPDGELLAVGCRDYSILLLDRERGDIIGQFAGHQGVPVRLGFHPTAPLLASYSWDNTLRHWRIESGAPVVAPIEGWLPAGFGEMVPATSGASLGTWTYSPSEVYDRLTSASAFGVNSEAAFLHGGRWLVTAGDCGVSLWECATGREVRVLSSEPANSVCVLGEGGLVIAGMDRGVLAWRIRAGAGDAEGPRELIARDAPGDLWVTPGPGPGAFTSVSRDGIRVMSADGTTLRALDPYTGLAERPDTSPDGRWLFTGNWRGPAAYVWDLDSGDQALRLEGSHVVARFSPSGDTLIVGTSDRFTCYETGSWRRRWSVERDWTDALAGVIAHAPDERFVAVGATRYQIRLLDPSTGEELATLRSPDMLALNEAAVSPDGSTLLCMTVDRVVQRWRLNTLRERLRDLHVALDPLGEHE